MRYKVKVSFSKTKKLQRPKIIININGDTLYFVKAPHGNGANKLIQAYTAPALHDTWRSLINDNEIRPLLWECVRVIEARSKRGK